MKTATLDVESVVDRYYDPSTDQFLSVDPLVAETGEQYAFAGDNPINATDPLGLYISGGGGTSEECNTAASGTIYCTGGNGNGVSAVGSYDPSTGAATGGFTSSAEASGAAAGEKVVAAQITATVLNSLTGGGTLKSPLAGCEQRYEASYCEGLSSASQEGLYCGNLSPGLCSQYSADVKAAKAIGDACAGVHGAGSALLATGATLGGGAISGLGFYGVADLVLNFTPFGIEADTAELGSLIFGGVGFVAGGTATGLGICSGNGIPAPVSP